jgi:hypothetical protein
MSRVIGTIYDSSWFQHDKEWKLFVSEISSVREVLRQLWHDSMDLGFGIRSIKTGQIAYFTLLDMERDDEGDVTRFVFTPVNPPEGLVGYKVYVYNT